MKKLKELRQTNNKSVEDICSLLNISLQAYYKYENGKSEPNIENLIKLAELYHVSLDELVGRPTSLINKMLLSERERSIIEKVLAMDLKQQELTEFYIDTMMGNIQR